MRTLTAILLLSLAALVVSCSGAGVTAPDSSLQWPGGSTEKSAAESNRWEWGCWKMYVPEDHSRVEVLPVRTGRLHYNVKGLLENAPCDNCLSVSKFVNNGDGTVSIDITIRHPYPGNSYYTGFDVRGIFYTTARYYFENPYEPHYVNARRFPALETGDPELLNADGYTDAYHPDKYPWEYPIFRYQPGGDLGGTLDSEDLGDEAWVEMWPFKCFYSSEVRRHFAPWAVETRTYHIALPPGPWEFGYSVDAVWAPPTKVPVTDIENDFPMQANTLYLYRIDMFVSGPIVGDEPVIVTMRGYSHFPELLEYYTGGSNATLYSECITGSWQWTVADPWVVDDEYLEVEFELVNKLHRPPGCYPVLGILGMSSAGSHYLKENVEKNYIKNAIIFQILWVTVES